MQELRACDGLQFLSRLQAHISSCSVSDETPLLFVPCPHKNAVAHIENARKDASNKLAPKTQKSERKISQTQPPNWHGCQKKTLVFHYFLAKIHKHMQNRSKIVENHLGPNHEVPGIPGKTRYFSDPACGELLRRS